MAVPQEKVDAYLSSLDLPEELKQVPQVNVGFVGLDPKNVETHKTIVDAFTSSRKVDTHGIHYSIIAGDREFPPAKPKRTTYEWFLPKGILKRKWMKKHLYDLPAVVIIFFDLDWGDPAWNEKKIGCSSRVKAIRAALTTQQTRLAVVLVQRAAAGDDPQAAERAADLCAACDLPPKSLWVLPITDHLSQYAMRLESAFYELAQTYYHQRVKAIRAHRELLSKSHHQALFVRHQFKLGFFCEVRQDMAAAYKAYQQGYAHLLELPTTDLTLCELKVVAAMLSFKVCRLAFRQNLPRDAIAHFRRHVELFRARVGPQELAVEHCGWLAQQYQWFGEVFDQAIQMGLPAIQTQHPGLYFEQAALHGRKRHQTAAALPLDGAQYPSPDPLAGSLETDFFGQRPWRPAGRNVELMDTEREKLGVLAIQLCERSVNHHNLVIPLLSSAISHFKKYHCPRMKERLMVQMAEEYALSGDHDKAVILLGKVLLLYRSERWWPLVVQVASLGLRSAYLSCQLEPYLAMAAALLSAAVPTPAEQRARLDANVHRLMAEERAAADKVVDNEKTAFFRQKAADLKPDGDMWHLIRTMDGRRPPAKPAVAISRPGTEGQPAQPTRPAVTDKEKADLFCQAYAQVSRLPKDKTSDHSIKIEARRATSQTCCNGGRDAFCSPFSRRELLLGIRKLRKGRSPGVDQEGLPQGSVLAPLLWLIYCNDIDDQLRAGDSSPTVSLFADDVALLATGRSLQECVDRLQPALDEVSRWVKTWKVQPSPSKCVMTTFTLDPKECGGKVKPQLSFCDHPLGYEETPTFLGLKLDCQLTFAAHIAALREKMAKRRACLSAIAGRSYGSHRSTLRIAYKSYVRSLFDYGAAIYFTHAAPAVRERLEVEQRKCARLITGCIKLTDKETLMAEAGLPPLSLRAKELAAGEYARIVRLPPGDPARNLLDKTPPPRLRYRAHEAWRRAVTSAEEAGLPPPPPADEDATLSFKPCFRRVGRWVCDRAGLSDLPVEPLALYQGAPPWHHCGDAVRFVLDLPQPTRRTDLPEKRKEAALAALALVPDPDCTIWSDGSAKEGTIQGGGGAILELHREGRTIECVAPAGRVCSSMRAELVAMTEALTCLHELPAPSKALIKRVLLCTDSRSGLQLLSRGPDDQQSAIGQRVWGLIDALTAAGKDITLHWVPGHADLAGNEAADRLANQAAADCAQEEAPIDLSSARTAIRRWTSELASARAQRHPHREPTPSHDELDRWGQATLSQLRTGYCPLVRATAHRLGLVEDPTCRACGEEEEDVEHLLAGCPAHRQPPEPEPGCAVAAGWPAALAAVHQPVPLELSSRDTLVSCSASFGAARYQQGRPLTVRLRLANLSAAPLPLQTARVAVAGRGAQTAAGGPLPAGAERVLTLDVPARLAELGSVVWLETVALELAAPDCLPLRLEWKLSLGDEQLHQSMFGLPVGAPFAELGGLCATVVPRPARLTLAADHRPPALVGEVYQLEACLTCDDLGAEVTDLVLEVSLLGADEETAKNTFVVYGDMCQPLSQPLQLPCGSVQPLASCRQLLGVQCLTAAGRQLQLAARYSEQTEAGLCQGRVAHTVGLEVVHPFQMSVRAVALTLEPVEAVGADQTALLIAQITNTGPHTVRLRSTLLQMDETLFTVCDSEGEEEDGTTSEDGAPAGGGLRDLVLQPMESATECVAVTAGAAAGAAQPGSYTVIWNRSEWDDRPVSTVSPAPALQVVPCPLQVTADLPAHGTVRTPLAVRYTVTNRSAHVYSLMMLMEPSDGFIFAGNKRYQFRVVPGGSRQLTYNLYPRLSGRLTLPRPRLTLYRDGAPVEAAELIDAALRHLPTHICVMPQEKGGPHDVQGLTDSIRAL
ncbi:Trafficking protein particle complex subunit 11 [Amphibalanus amphitrite]|uniref:Trafficking protein particle complex subunit 11 n=1 Tax=Amphibalanus amphitrite TaxID=1232801 RepID=A0A6A4X2Q3_AMPAM|nr:Trafficking protein particle complex subunit 11 [Amphibalanus amphitrite]